MSDAAPPRRIWLCADDYGLSPGVNRAIRDLIERGRLNATSVMVVGPSIGRDEVSALQAVAASSSRWRAGIAMRPLPSSVNAAGPWKTTLATKPHESALCATLAQGAGRVNSGKRQKSMESRT